MALIKYDILNRFSGEVQFTAEIECAPDEIATTEELIQTAAGVFEIPMQTSCRKMAEAIDEMSKSERRRLARKNIGALPIRRVRTSKEANKAVVDALAAELEVSATDLRVALRALASRYKAIRA